MALHQLIVGKTIDEVRVYPDESLLDAESVRFIFTDGTDLTITGDDWIQFGGYTVAAALRKEYDERTRVDKDALLERIAKEQAENPGVT